MGIGLVRLRAIAARLGLMKKPYKFGEKKPFWATSFGESATFAPM